MTSRAFSVPKDMIIILSKTDLSKSERRLFDALLMKILGFGKDQDVISIGQLEKMTGLSRRQIIYGIQNLESKRMIYVRRKRGRGHKNEPNLISLERNSSKWVVQENSPQYRKALNDRKKHYRKSSKSIVQETLGSANADNIKLVTDCLIKGSTNKIRFLAPTYNNIYIRKSPRIEDDCIEGSKGGVDDHSVLLRDIADPPIPICNDDEFDLKVP